MHTSSEPCVLEARLLWLTGATDLTGQHCTLRHDVVAPTHRYTALSIGPDPATTMVHVSRNAEQTLLCSPYTLTVIEVGVCDLIDPSDRSILDLDSYLGIACSQDAKGIVTHLAFAITSSSVVSVCLAGRDPKTEWYWSCHQLSALSAAHSSLPRPPTEDSAQ